MVYWCYILRNTEEKYKNHSYCGFTTDPIKRLRQHNKEIKGGAKATRKGTWEFIILITGFKTYNNALSCEWKLKHPDGKRRKNIKYNGINGKINTINTVLKLEKWTEQCDILNEDCEYIAFIASDIYKNLDINNIPKNITMIDVENLSDIFIKDQ
jgi:predicted GIY-YIG superfamily endonuclease